jgi:hypothetical protein
VADAPALVVVHVVELGFVGTIPVIFEGMVPALLIVHL